MGSTQCKNAINTDTGNILMEISASLHARFYSQHKSDPETIRYNLISNRIEKEIQEISRQSMLRPSSNWRLEQVRENVNKALDKSTAQEQLKELSSSKYFVVRAAVALNSITEVPTLIKMTRDKDPAISWLAFSNHNLDSNIMGHPSVARDLGF